MLYSEIDRTQVTAELKKRRWVTVLPAAARLAWHTSVGATQPACANHQPPCGTLAPMRPAACTASSQSI